MISIVISYIEKKKKNKQHDHHLSLELYIYGGPSFGDW